MKRITCILILLACSTAMAQYVPRTIVRLNNGSALFGRIIDTANGYTTIMLETGRPFQTRKENVVEGFRIPEDQREAIRKQLASPELAIGLSLLVNGAGQIYNGDYVEGMLHMGIQALAVAIILSGNADGNAATATSGYILLGIMKTVSFIDAGRQAEMMNRIRIHRTLLDFAGVPRDKDPELLLGLTPIPDGAAGTVQVRF